MRCRRAFGAAWPAAAGAATLALVAGEAAAGAWTQKAGAGQLIASVGRNGAPQSPLSGAGSPVDSTLSQLYLEYGYSDTLTLGGAAFVDVPDADRAGEGRALVSFFGRQRLWQGEDGDVASVQVGYAHPVEPLVGESFGARNPNAVPELRLRALYGRGFWGEWGNAFVSLAAGYTWRGEGAPDQVQIDGTTGYAPWDCCMILFSNFNTLSLGDDDTTAVKISPSFAYTLGGGNGEDADDDPDGVTLEFGVTQDLLDLEEGFGVEFSVWQPF